jgi:hypothetical protein
VVPSECCVFIAEGENSESSIHELLMSPVQITDEILAERAKTRQFSDLAYELLKESAGILYSCVCSRADVGQGPQLFSGNQAICIGLLVRITPPLVLVMTASALSIPAGYPLKLD